MSGRPALTYGTCVALGPVAALLLGRSGSGKSDLALRFAMMMPAAEGPFLVADDQVLLEALDGRVIARPPAALAGKIEVRGIGIVSLPFRAEAELRLAIRLSEPDDVPRMPPVTLPAITLAGVDVPVLRLAPFEASAPWKLRLALEGIAR